MTLKTQIEFDLSMIFSPDEFADDVIYTPSGGEAVSIKAIFDDIDPSIMDVSPPGDSMILYVQISDVADPQRGDNFTIETEIWHLVRNLGGGPHLGYWKIEISRSDKRRIG